MSPERAVPEDLERGAQLFEIPSRTSSDIPIPITHIDYHMAASFSGTGLPYGGFIILH